MPLINSWWRIKKLFCNIRLVFTKQITINLRRPIMEYEYNVVKLGSNSSKNADLLNKKSSEGWELVSTSPVTRMSQSNGNMVTDIQAFLKRKKTNRVISE